jgi:Flp pilus assembly protein TadG
MMIRNLSKNRRGGVLAITALTLPLVILLAALAVDYGIALIAKSKGEHAAIAAAEAGAVRLPDEAGAVTIANSVARGILSDAGYAADHAIDVTTGAGAITVSVSITVPATFAKLSGVNAITTVSEITRP